jgi:RNA polymerase sigma-70 factor (ECF subfamily)
MSTYPVTAAVADLLAIVPAHDALALGESESSEVRALVDAARAGDREAFGRLVDLHEHAVIRTAMAALGRREDAEDVAQDAFVVAWRKLSGFRGDASFRTWLLTIVWRRALDRRRARQRCWSRSASFDAIAVQHAAAAKSDLPSPERAALTSDFRRRLALEIARLSPKLRDTLLLAASGEHSYDEIARLLGIRVGTVKWRVSEARRQVARRFGLRKDV